jgi:hypothetical protein
MNNRQLENGLTGALVAVAFVLHGLTAGTSDAASQITTTNTSNVFNSASKFYSHCANGYYWVALRNGSSVVVFSSIDGATWISQGAIFTFNPGVNRWAVRYEGNVVVAFGFNDGDSTRYYRKATLNGNGTLSWNAAEVAVGAADAASPELNALIANGKPILWRAGPTNGDLGRFSIGDQLDSPVVWTDTPNAPSLGPASIPGNGSNGRFSAGAIFATGGADPDDLIVLRSTSDSAATLGSHRLVTVKYDASLNAFDSGWYNVSTIGGSLAEDNTTEVGVYSTDEESHRRFAVVADSSGSLHAVYKNQSANIVHYQKDPGFNDSWTRRSTDILGVNGGKVALTAAANDNLFLFFESTPAINVLQVQRFNGATWGAANTLFSGTDLQKSLAAMERFGNCAPALAFTHGASSPFDVLFTLDTASCAPLQASETGNTITVTGAGSFEMTFDTSAGGGIESFYDLAENPGKTVDLAAGDNPKALHNFGIRTGSLNYNSSTDAVSSSIHLLEATPTRVRVRQDSGFDNNNTGNLLGGVRGISNYSVYPSGRIALNQRRIAYIAMPYQNEYTELVVHYTSAAPPLDTWQSLYQLVGAGVGAGNDDFTLSQNEVANARTDFLHILSEDWVAGPKHQSSATLTDRTFNVPSDRLNAYWYDAAGGTIPAGNVDVWDSLTYFKPTNFIDHNDPQVTARSADYRAPDDIAGGDFAAGTRWDEDGNDDGFNEAEAAYTLETDPVNGLTFDMDGSSTIRHSPFFKIRQWRSLSEPASVSLEGTTLADNVDYRTDVKPLSRAYASRDIIWYSTLQNPSALSTPNVGTAATIIGTPVQAAARYGGGYFFNGSSDAIRFGNSGFTPDYGMVEFWVQPQSVHTDGANRVFWYNEGSGSEFFRIRKSSASDLELEVHDGTGTALVQIDSSNFRWVAGDWVHIRAVWDDNQAAGLQVRLYVNGREPAHTDSGAYNGAVMSMSWNHIGNESNGNPFANAIIDEFALYNNALAPFERAHGGLTSSGTEFLASTTNNWQPGLFAVDANRQGGYFYFGSDSKFRGLNISLAQAGVGTPDLVWEYWNGTSWANLESVAGFTDELNDLTQPDGTIYWTADPPSWSPYSVVGGPDLYYVRVHGSNTHAYTTYPTEALIKTDILLVAYCGDITAPAMTFDFALPTPTSVELVSFDARGVDCGVELAWETGSELDNLGFHLYRSESSTGPFDRITPSPIPGLGSSPAGARYSFHDTGLTNGVAYYYQLEDIETTGASELHGPVEATPEPGGAFDTTTPEEEGDANARVTYGDPDASTLRITPRNNGVVLELVTRGFVAVPQSDGTVRLEIPGLDEIAGSSLPVRRAWVEAIAGRNVELVSVRARGVSRFDGLRPGAALVSEVVASAQGTVQPRQIRRGKRLARREGARLVEVGYQGELKKALVELSPLTWDGSALQLASTLEVHVAFRGREAPVRRPRPGKDRVAARLVTIERGLYGVALDDVIGRRRARSTHALRLSRQGVGVPFHLENGVLYFWSEGASENPYGSESVYELEPGVAGETMDVVNGSQDAAFYIENVERHENRIYQAGLVDAPDVWLWDVLFAPETKSFDFEVRDLAGVPNISELELWLQGTSDAAGVVDHHIRVSINGTFVDERRWDGKSAEKLEAGLGLGVLREGVNTLEIENVGDTGAPYSMVMLDRFRIRYPRNAEAISSAAYAIDVTERPRWVRSGLESSRSYVGADELLRPELRRPVKTNLKKRRRAEYLVIGPESLLDDAAPLVRHRRAQGLTVATVSTEAIASAFGHGELSPESIREFIAHAYHEWRAPKLRFVVLLGDATYDFKDDLGTGVVNHVPPYMVRTSYLWTASDPAYAAVHGDDLMPDVAIGRLPASSADELRAMVAKILAFERGERSLDTPFVLVADDSDHAGNFERDADEIASTILMGRHTRRIYLSDLGAPATRDAIAESFDAGAATMSYLGHGAIHLWADENLFNASGIERLSPQPHQPLVLTMNCLNGYFHFPYFDSLAEALLKKRDKGAIAAFSPSGLSLNAPAHGYHKALLEELLGGVHETLGDAVLAAQRRYADSGAFPELLAIYHLFGDPALPLAIQR